MIGEQPKKTYALIAASAILLVISFANVAVASNSSSKNFAELVWGNGTSWSMVAPPSPEPHPGAVQAQEDFYEEAPQMPSANFPVSPQSNECDHLGIVPGSNTTPCLHDHTLGSVPGQPGFSVLWHVFIVLCGPITSQTVLGQTSFTASPGNSCKAESVTGVPFGGSSRITLNIASVVNIGGTATPLTTGSAVESAASAGIVTLIDTHVTFICPVQPFKG